MLTTLDRRTRRDEDIRHRRPDEYFDGEFRTLVAGNGHLVVEAMSALDARPLTLDVGGQPWTILAGDDTLVARRGGHDGALTVALSEEQFSDWVQNQMSLQAMLLGRAIACRRADVRQLSIWDALWVTLLDGWPAVAETLTFVDRYGAPLDLHQRFGPEDDPADIAHFLREAGYLRLRGWLDPADMARIGADMDRVLPTYSEGDGKSWWATMQDGSRRCVRMQEFVEHSPTTAAILGGPVWEKLHRTVAAEEALERPPVEGRVIEALIKPVGVASGPSDLPFHRDCHFGRHIYTCSHLTIGIALTRTGADNGMLQVAAGSHRVNMPVEIAITDPYLPVIDLETEPGDLTVHLSCTLHAATAPRLSERRVMYTSFRQPDRVGAPRRNAAVARLREQVSELTK